MVESSERPHGSVLLICRERKLHGRRTKHVRTQADRKTLSEESKRDIAPCYRQPFFHNPQP